jgi:hypothetical protein
MLSSSALLSLLLFWSLAPQRRCYDRGAVVGVAMIVEVLLSSMMLSMLSSSALL